MKDLSREIKKTIEKVDYIIVVQSYALASKNIGYVNKEISTALERQKYFRGIRFIIPVKIDDSPILEDLKFLQTIDLKQQNDIEQLFRLIKRDQERRKKG